MTAVELTRRLVLHREIDPQYRFPEVEWQDVKEILYGAGDESLLFPGQKWGGMTADTAIFLQTALGIGGNGRGTIPGDDREIRSPKVPFNSNNEWRIFSKLGAGFSTSRYVGEIVTNAYGKETNLYMMF